MSEPYKADKKHCYLCKRRIWGWHTTIPKGDMSAHSNCVLAVAYYREAKEAGGIAYE